MHESRWHGPLGIFVRRIVEIDISDPWSIDLDIAVRAPDAVPLCLNCLFPQEGYWWFCPHCGFPGGEYATWLPYPQLFVVGELFQRGVCGPRERNGFITTGLVVSSAMNYLMFAPLYWYWMIRKSRGRPISSGRRVELEVEKNAHEPMA